MNLNKIRLIVVFIFSCIGSILIMPSTFSIFKSDATATKILALASWSVSLNQNGVNDELEIIADNTSTASYTLNVTSASEVSVKYSVVLSNLPAGVTVSIDGGNFMPQQSNTITFSDIGTILYSDSVKTKTHTLTFKSAVGGAVVSDHEVDIDVIARQFLPNE